MDAIAGVVHGAWRGLGVPALTNLYGAPYLVAGAREANVLRKEDLEDTMLNFVRTTVLVLAAASTFAGGALAAGSCKGQADAKNLHGAAQTSFLAKCEKDARSKCSSDAKAKGLHGAAETSFTTKCVKDATGA